MPSLACPQEASHMWSDDAPLPSYVVSSLHPTTPAVRGSCSQQALFSSSPLSYLRLFPGSPPSLPSRSLCFLFPPFSLLIRHSPPPRGGAPLLPHRLLRRFYASAAAASADESRSYGDRVVARSSSELRMGRPGGSGAGIAGDNKLRSLRELFTSPDVVMLPTSIGSFFWTWWLSNRNA